MARRTARKIRAVGWRLRGIVAPSRGSLVSVYGLIGYSGRLLLVRCRDTSGYHIPGGLVRPHESIQSALRRILHDQINAVPQHCDLWGTLELCGNVVSGGPAVYELALLFDVTLADPDAVHSEEHELAWLPVTGLRDINLTPAAVAELLSGDAVPKQHSWWPHRS